MIDMWGKASISTRMVALTVVVFALVAGVVLFVADTHIMRIVNRSQTAVYEERITAILNYLERRRERLHETGMPEVYREGFQSSTLESLRGTYYSKDAKVYPFIQGVDGSAVLHPVEPYGSMKYAHLDFVQKAIRMENGELEYTSAYGDRRWAIFQMYEPWGWLVGYSVPVDVKYADADSLFVRLVVLLIVVSCIAAGVIAYFSWRLTRPIARLTSASESIANGDLVCVDDFGGAGEVGVLGRRFREMSVSIGEKVQALEDNARELENEIEERKKAEEQNVHLRAFLKDVIDSIPSGLIGVDEGRRIVLWNHEAGRMFNVSEDGAMGHDLAQVLPELASELEWNLLQQAPNASWISSDLAPLCESGPCYHEVLVVPFAGDAFCGSVIRVDDVTDRLRLEESMVLTEKMMSVGGLAVGMAHEINNPLGGILQGVQNIERRLSDALPGNLKQAEQVGVELELVREYLEKRKVLKMLDGIRDSGLRAARTISNVMDFSNPREVRHYPVNLDRIVKSALELADSEYDMRSSYDFRKITVEKVVAEDMPLVSCGWSEMEHVVLNVVRNAAQAMIGVTENPRIDISLYTEGEVAVLDIADNGPGMPEDVRKRIFEPFYTTKDPDLGSGLGLSVSYFIVTQNHDGEFLVFSEPGQGTRFSIRLPVAS